MLARLTAPGLGLLRLRCSWVGVTPVRAAPMCAGPVQVLEWSLGCLTNPLPGVSLAH